ncbi:hypothetical protein PSI15_09505 [Xenorhabdus sp. PR6a]|uniref:hypothetical protein n=1 Tax=Xenorhabdus sp. PR6a TaxID=3025877 RepID=UPI00235A0C6B|nr:hypothetical protein [Xenorhabdus sp. PR6a]MDC9581800.1 hypothetical protein [Xenorhabdus sp. PR6a]
MAVLKRFNSDLENKLNQLWYHGFVTFERWELLCWFEKDRITKAVWADIVEAWDEWFDEPVELKVVKADSSSTPQRYLVIRADKLTDLSELTD